MKRIKVLIGKRRVMVIATLAILVLAALVASSASFTSSSANPGNIFTAGTLKSTSTGAVMHLTGLKPDNNWITAGTVTVTNTGDIDGAFTLAGVVTDDASGTGHSGKLSDVLRIRVHAASQADPNTYVYNGNVAGLAAGVAAGTILGGGTHNDVYTFQVEFPNGTTSYLPDAGDNIYQGASLTMTFDWTAINL